MACPPPRTVLARFRAHGSPSFSVPEAYFVHAQHSHEQRFGMEPRTISLPLSVWLSSVLPRLIPWLIHIPADYVVTPRCSHNSLDLAIRYPHDISSAPGVRTHFPKWPLI